MRNKSETGVGNKVETRQFGSTEQIKVNVRIIAASNTSLEKEVANGTFRKDLFYRLNVVTIEIPPLRNRREDIPMLSYYFLSTAQDTASISTAYLQMLLIN
ncbi:MAG: sigma 54-interacting transcriptional regulator [Thermodesulfovibrionales bacterium]